MLSQSTLSIQRNFCLTPEKRKALTYFLLGATLTYGGVLFGKECASSFSLTQEELYAFMKQSMDWLIPLTGVDGLVAGAIGYCLGKRESRELAILDGQLAEPLNEANINKANIQEKEAQYPVTNSSGEFPGEYGLTAEEEDSEVEIGSSMNPVMGKSRGS